MAKNMEDEMPFEEEAPEMEESGMEADLDDALEADLGDEGLGLDSEMGGGSIEEGVQGLLDNWQPTTPEGEQYKQELQDLLGGPEEGAMEEDMEYEEGGLAPKAFGFQIGMMGKEAAKRALEPKEA